MATRFVFNSRLSQSPSLYSVASMSNQPGTSTGAEDEVRPIPVVIRQAVITQPRPSAPQAVMTQSAASVQPAVITQPPVEEATASAEQPMSNRRRRLLARRSTPNDPTEVQVVVHFVDAASHGGTEQALDWLLSCLSEEDKAAVRAKSLSPSGNACFWFATVEAGYAALWSFAGRANPNGEPVVPRWGYAMQPQTWQRVLAACNMPSTQPIPRRVPQERFEAWKLEMREHARQYQEQLARQAQEAVAQPAAGPSTSQATLAEVAGTSRESLASVHTLADDDAGGAAALPSLDEPELFANEAAAQEADSALEQELTRLNVGVLPPRSARNWAPIPDHQGDSTDLNPTWLTDAVRRLTGAGTAFGSVVLMAPPMIPSLFERAGRIIDDWTAAGGREAPGHTALRDWCLRECLRLEQVCTELTEHGPPTEEARRIIHWAWQLRIVELCKWRSSDPLVHVHRLKAALMLTRRVVMRARTNDWRERYVLERGEARSVPFDTPKAWQQDRGDRIELIPFGASSILNFETNARI